MKIRAAISDIYGTLLEVSPPPADAEARWAALWNRQFQVQPRVGLVEFGDQCDQIIRREHTAARARGIPFPEIYWSAVAGEVLPELDRLTDQEREDFLYEQAQIWHTVRLMPEANEALLRLQSRGVLLGLASNAQSYTERELGLALESAGLNARLFQQDICFWSFKHGFSKPDPHVFRILTARLRARVCARRKSSWWVIVWIATSSRLARMAGRPGNYLSRRRWAQEAAGLRLH